MEQIILVKEETLFFVNKELEEGWKVKSIVPFSQPVHRDGSSHGVTVQGLYGAYVVLEKGE